MLVVNSLFLTLSIVLVFFWTQNPYLSRFSAQLIGLLVILYFLNYFFGKNNLNQGRRLINGAIFTAVILLVVISTGGLESPAIFLIFVEAAALSLLFHPLIACFLLAIIGILLERSATLNGIKTDMSYLLTWLFIPPFIGFIVKEHLKILESEQKIKILETQKKIFQEEINKIEEDVASFSKSTQETLADLWSNLNLLLSKTPYRDSPSLKKVAGDLKNLQKRLQNLPEEIEEEAGK